METDLAPKRVDGASQRLRERPGSGSVRVAGRRVHGAALDKHAHHHHKSDADEQHTVPILLKKRDLNYQRFIFYIKKQIFFTHCLNIYLP